MVTTEEFKKMDEKDIKEGKESKITEDIELKTELFKVKGSLNKNITSDYTLAFLTKDDREFITENYQNAEYAKSIIMRYAEKGYRYVWNDDTGDWERDKDGVPLRVSITPQEKKIIKEMANRTFELFMNRPHMITILGRNRSDNFMIKLLGKNKDDNEEETPIGMMTQKSFAEKVMDKLKGVEYEEE